ncbi:STAS domain-containing protein [Streptomyces bryophytorum]|nr:STAS domain-containing protein [Actinacidiphila bryophytorum]MBN6541632.1 STAS domain-containing protein [Actinacidiphila bryophytorum]
MVEDGGRVRVSVGGEIDLGCADMLRQVLAECLRTAPRGVDVDLTGLGFCDSSGLNALLQAREHALAVGAPLTVSAVSAPVARVLDLTHCGDAFPEAVVSVPFGRRHGRRSARCGDAADNGRGVTDRRPNGAGQEPRALRLHVEAVLARRLGMAVLPA